MFSSITEQFSAATKSQLESQLKLLNTYATTAFEGAQKVIALNISTTKASVEKSAEAAKQLLEAKDPKEYFSVAKAQSFDGVLAYGRELFSIASKAQADLLQATKDQLKESNVQVKPLVLEAPVVAKPAPVAVAVAKPAVVEEEFPSEPEEPAIEAAAPKAPKSKPAKPAVEAAPKKQ
ncbi:TIGR01841 family phasin [Pseudoduganella sp. RAF53_2]|uniref:TIGR01841 family phasin n=1 Tax=unclassified Pseudoduganella TaxID=2637179 RepID=UPI003F98BBF4